MDYTLTNHARIRFKERYGGKLPNYFEDKGIEVLKKDNYYNIKACKLGKLPIYFISDLNDNKIITFLTKKQFKERYGKNKKGTGKNKKTYYWK